MFPIMIKLETIVIEVKFFDLMLKDDMISIMLLMMMVIMMMMN